MTLACGSALTAVVTMASTTQETTICSITSILTYIVIVFKNVKLLHHLYLAIRTVPCVTREFTPVERILDLRRSASSLKRESPGFSHGECHNWCKLHKRNATNE
jgi:hypothetical protein